MASELDNNAWLLDQQWNAKMKPVLDAQKNKQFSQLTAPELGQFQKQWSSVPGSVMPGLDIQQKAWEGQRDYAANNLSQGSIYKPTARPEPPTQMISNLPNSTLQSVSGAPTNQTGISSLLPTAGTKDGALTGTKPISGLPAGFNIRTGSTDPTDPTGQNRSVYGDNYFPGGLQGFEGVTNAQQFNALTPQQQGDYREALYLAHLGIAATPTAGTKPFSPVAGTTPSAGQKPNSPYTPVTPVNPGNGVPPPVTPNTPSAPPMQDAGNQYQGPPNGAPTRDPNALDDPQSTFDNGLRFPQQSITPTDVMMDPGFKWQQEQQARALEDMFAAKGRVGSTDYFNTKSNANQKLLSDEYNRINNQQWDRGMETNRLLYDRRVQENATSYEREYRENERAYGRAKADEMLAYDRGFREDARDYDRVRYLYQSGLDAANGGGNNSTGQSIASILQQLAQGQGNNAAAQGSVSGNLYGSLPQSILYYLLMNGGLGGGS